ncbi:Uncharacterized protein T09_7795, partial [Trichinella sp. T9]
MAETQHVLATRMGSLRLGHIEEFDTSNPKEWNSYASRLMFYLEANKVSADADKRAVLLSSCGSTLFKLVESLLSPAKPVERSFDEIISVLNDHFAPQPSEIVNRHIFYQRKQQPGETVAEFIADLRRLAQGCNFVDLETMLRDRLVCGLRDEAVQLRLFAKKVLTFQMAQEEALSAEAACKHASEIRAVNVDSSAPNIHHMSSKRQTYKQANVCASCGGQHNRALCRFKNAVCRCCQKVGHIERVCRSKQRRSKPQAKANTISVADTHQSYLLNRISCRSTPSLRSLKLSVFLSIEGKRCQLEVDSGSDVTIISEQTFEYLRNNNKKLKLAPTTLSLVSFLGKQVKLMGSCVVNVDYSSIHTRLRIFVAKGNCPNLLGLEWFKPLGIRIEGINHISSSPVESVLRKYKAVFTPDLGCYAGEPVSLDLDPSVPPIRMKARKVPFALKEKIDMELDKLVKQKVLEPVSHPVWATPIVTPMKPDGSVRICGDYKCTINKALLKHAYPVPAVSHLLASLAGGKVFAKLDLAQAYQQLVVDKKTADAQTIITHRGAFRVKRLQFGVSAAPGIFQGVIDQLTKGIPGVLPYFDDILIAAKDESILAKRLATLLKRFYDAGLRLNAEKCKFCLRRIEFLGFDIDVSGIHPSKQKVAAIHNTPQPRNKKELQTFLGLLNFYHSFLRNKATVAEPLHRTRSATSERPEENRQQLEEKAGTLQMGACPGNGHSILPVAVPPTCWRPPVLFSSGTEPNRWITSLEIFLKASGLPRCQWAVAALNHMDSAIQERLTARLGDDVNDYEVLKADLKKMFIPLKSEMSLRAEFCRLRQRPGQPVDAFAIRVQEAGERIWMTELQIVDRFREGTISRAVLMALLEKEPMTMDEARRTALKAVEIEEASRSMDFDNNSPYDRRMEELTGGLNRLITRLDDRLPPRERTTKPAPTSDTYQRKHPATIEARLEKLEEYYMRNRGSRTSREHPQPSRRLEGSSRKADYPLASATDVVIGDTPVINGKIRGFSIFAHSIFARFRSCHANHFQRGLGEVICQRSGRRRSKSTMGSESGQEGSNLKRARGSFCSVVLGSWTHRLPFVVAEDLSFPGIL